MEQQHKIAEAVFNIGFADHGQMLERSGMLGGLVRDRLAPRISNVFGAWDTDREVLRIDRMEINLGTVAYEDLETVLADRLEQAMQNALHTPPAGTNPSSAGEPLRVPAQQNDLDLILHFLLTGRLPWWAERRPQSDLNRSLSNLIDRAHHELIACLRRQSVPNNPVLSRLVRQFKPGLVLRLIARLAPSAVRAIEQGMTVLSALHEARALLPLQSREMAWAMWETMLRRLLVPTGADRSINTLVAAALQEVGASHQLSPASLLRNLRISSKRLGIAARSTDWKGPINNMLAYLEMEAAGQPAQQPLHTPHKAMTLPFPRERSHGVNSSIYPESDVAGKETSQTFRAPEQIRTSQFSAESNIEKQSENFKADSDGLPIPEQDAAMKQVLISQFLQALTHPRLEGFDRVWRLLPAALTETVRSLIHRHARQKTVRRALARYLSPQQFHDLIEVMAPRHADFMAALVDNFAYFQPNVPAQSTDPAIVSTRFREEILTCLLEERTIRSSREHYCARTVHRLAVYYNMDSSELSGFIRASIAGSAEIEDKTRQQLLTIPDVLHTQPGRSDIRPPHDRSDPLPSRADSRSVRLKHNPQTPPLPEEDRLDPTLGPRKKRIIPYCAGFRLGCKALRVGNIGHIHRSEQRSCRVERQARRDNSFFPGPLMQAGPGEPSEDVPASSIYVQNAGMVLAAPFLPRLFGMLGMLEEKRFRNRSAKERAVHFLEFLVNERHVAPEFQLVLNKILCGLDDFIPIADGFDPTRHEINAIHQMLEGMIGHWKIIGNTSVGGLRSSFLQRQGYLMLKNDAWHLQVESRPFDMLLDQLPWSIAVIRHSWMTRVLHVSWR